MFISSSIKRTLDGQKSQHFRSTKAGGVKVFGWKISRRFFTGSQWGYARTRSPPTKRCATRDNNTFFSLFPVTFTIDRRKHASSAFYNLTAATGKKRKKKKEEVNRQKRSARGLPFWWKFMRHARARKEQDFQLLSFHTFLADTSSFVDHCSVR